MCTDSQIFLFKWNIFFKNITFDPLWGYFLSQHIYFNTSFQPQRHTISSAIVVLHCVIPARNTDRTAGFFFSPLPVPAGVTLAAVMQQMPLSRLFICARENSEAPTSVPAVNCLQIGFSKFASSQSGLVFLLPVILGINLH